MKPPPGSLDRFTPATPELLAAAIARAGAGNALLGIGTGAGAALPAARLCDPSRPGPATDLVDAVGAWLGRPERRVAASLVVLGYAARLVGPTLAVLLREGLLLDARPHRVHYAYAPRRGFTLDLPHPAGWQPPGTEQVPAWCHTVLDSHLAPLVAAVRADTPVAAGLLWGNVASGITGALRAVTGTGAVPVHKGHTFGLSILDHDPLRGSGTLTVHSGSLGFRRRSCCLYYRLPGGGTCGDCPLATGARSP